MDPITQQVLLAAAGGGELKPGDAHEGGFFAGYISQNANGIATHGLIVASAATGYNNENPLQWKTADTSTSGTSSLFDGATNTANMANSSHPAANYCAGLTIDGYSDWYLPARYELEIAYYNLKPSTDSNNTSFGTNPYSVPARGSNWTAGNPAQTSATAFQSGGAQDFLISGSAGYHFSSSEFNSQTAWAVLFQTGRQITDFKTTNNMSVRAFRKFAV